LTRETAVALSVSDTGIGMTPEQQKVVSKPSSKQMGPHPSICGTGAGAGDHPRMVARLGGRFC